MPNNKLHIATYPAHLFFTYLPLRLLHAGLRGPRNKDGNITGLHGERERSIRECTAPTTAKRAAARSKAKQVQREREEDPSHTSR